MLKIMELIKNYGLENYKKFVDDYNKGLEQQQKNGTLITLEEIINALFVNLDENKKI